MFCDVTRTWQEAADGSSRRQPRPSVQNTMCSVSIVQTIRQERQVGLCKHCKGKGKYHARTGHEGPEGEQRYSSTLSLTSALDVGLLG